ncbi:MAG: putative Ig domain-containing protein [Propionibacteriales bacterium]|nr:putative Ig domain-containing protein [Propionibacteriales bacterium]
MFSRISSFRFVAAVLAALLLVAGLQTAASAATTRSLTISASPAVGVAGTAVTFAGKITRSPRGTTVYIERKSGARWVRAGSTRTVNTAGSYAVKLTRPKTVANYFYRATSPKKGTLKAAVSKTITVAALRRTLVSLSSSAAQTTAGSAVTLSGTVLPSVKGTTVTIQKKVGSSWSTVTTTTVTANGTFSKGVVPTTTTNYRAVVSRTTLNAPGTSNERVVQAKPLITTTSLTAGTRLGSYSLTLTTLGNQVGTWSTSSLPAGLTLNTSTGRISGTPTAVGDTNVVIGFTQLSTGLAAATKTLTLRINQATAPTISTSSLPDGTRLSPYTATLTANGNPTGTWTASPLPDGLSLTGNTISGTPTAIGTTQVVIGFTQTNTGLSAPTRTIALKINQATAPVITTTSLPNGTAGSDYSTTVTATTAGNPVTGTWSSASLPANGLSLNPTTGVISGNPVADGDMDITVGFTQTSSGLAAAPRNYTLRVGAANAPLITTTALPDATRFSAYSFTVTADAAGTWTSSGLPSGLTLSSGGAISGTTTVAPGDYPVTFQFTRTSPAGSATKTLTLTVNQAASPVISTTSLPDGNRFAVYSTALSASGATGTWTASPLPDGLAINPSTGVISGTPQNPAAPDAFEDTSVVIGFTDGTTNLPASPKTLNLRVLQAPAPVIGTANLPDGTRFANYATTLTAVGNPAGTWTASPLPAGLSLNQTTGAITGIPTAVGDTSVVIGFTQNSTGLAATPKTLTLHVNETSKPVITTTVLPDGLRYRAYTTTLTVAGNPVGTWTSTSLPTGMSFNTSTGVLSGTPRNAGDTNISFTFTQTNSGLTSDTKTLQLHVVQSAPLILTTSLPEATVFTFYKQTLQVAPAPVGTWSFVTGGFPIASGMSLDKATGVISGTPLYGFSKDLVLRFTETSTGLSSQVTLPFKAS